LLLRYIIGYMSLFVTYVSRYSTFDSIIMALYSLFCADVPLSNYSPKCIWRHGFVRTRWDYSGLPTYAFYAPTKC